MSMVDSGILIIGRSAGVILQQIQNIKRKIEMQKMNYLLFIGHPKLSFAGSSND